MLDRLTLDQLRILVAVAEEGSFSSAARRLGRVQSAVSQSVQALEATLGITLFDRSERAPKLNDAGRAMLADAQEVLRSAESLRAHADNIRSDVEPELSLAVDTMFPSDVLMAGLQGLSREFPLLPVTLFTEGLGGAEQRLRERVARLGFYVPLPTRASTDLTGELVAEILMIPVVAAKHELAHQPAPLSRETIGRHVQLVLTDRTQLTTGFSGKVLSQRVWRFADLATRREYLLAGFGWCFMPMHLVAAGIEGGQLKRLELAEHRGREFTLAIHVMHERGSPPGRAGQWLIAELRRLMPIISPLATART